MKTLEQVCKNCTAQTRKVYSTSIRRLYKIYDKPIKDLKELPKNKAWLLSDKLSKKYKQFPNNVRRHLSSAGFIATKLYGMKPDNVWSKRMIDDSQEYEKKREKNNRSEYEEKNLPLLKEIIEATKQYKNQIKKVFVKTPTLSNLYKYQLYLALKLMATSTPFRNDLPTLNVEKQKGNYITKQKNQYTIVMTSYKNSDKLGKREIKLDRSASMELKKFLSYRDKVDLNHDFLFSLKNGRPMSKSAFSQALISLTQKLLDKKVGSRIIRVAFATSKKAELEEADKLVNNMLHSKTGKQTRKYVRKD